MQNEKKELIKSFKVVIEDLLDNYEKYTDEEKAQIKDIFQKVADLNAILDKYDIDTVLCDYISSMSDMYAVKTFSEIFIPKNWKL